MKKLIMLFVILTSTLNYSQIYEGTATVSMVSGDYASIVFGRSGHSPTIFKIKISDLDETKSKLVEGKKYYFVLKKVKYKGTSKNAEVIFHDKDRQQFNKELNEAKEKIKGVIIWL